MTTINTNSKFKKLNSEQTAGLLTVTALVVALAGILILNAPPYKRLVSNAFLTAFGINLWPWLSWTLGVIILHGIQAAEVRPIFLHNPPLEKYERIKWVSLMAYCLDLILGWFAWPPVENLSRWWVTKSLNEVNWVHMIMIICTVYGFSWLMSQLKTISKDLEV